MKKQLKQIIILVSFSLFFSSFALAASYLSVTTDNANVRTGPGTKYPVAMELFQGYPLLVLKQKGEWYKVSDFEKDSGWIHDSIVKNNNSVIVSAKKSVNMRSGPSTNDGIVADVERGVVLKRLRVKGKWANVQHSSGTVGWIYASLLWPQ